jgi:hypothetical protein
MKKKDIEYTQVLGVLILSESFNIFIGKKKESHTCMLTKSDRTELTAHTGKITHIYMIGK